MEVENSTQTGVTGATVTAEKTIGQIAHEALAKFEGEVDHAWETMSDEAKLEAEKFATIIEAVVKHMLNKPVNFANVTTQAAVTPQPE